MKRTISIILAFIMCLSILVVGTVSSASAKTLPKVQMYIIPDWYKGNNVCSYSLDEFNDYQCNFMLKIGNSKFYNANKLVNSASISSKYFAYNFNSSKHNLIIAIKNAINKNVSVKAKVSITNSSKVINSFINSCVNKNKNPLAYKSLKNFLCNNKQVIATTTFYANKFKAKIVEVKNDDNFVRVAKCRFLTRFDRVHYNFGQFNNKISKDGYYIWLGLKKVPSLSHLFTINIPISHKNTNSSLKNITRELFIEPSLLFNVGYIIS